MNKFMLMAMTITLVINSYITVPTVVKAASVQDEGATKVSTRQFAIDTKKDISSFKEEQEMTKAEKNLLARLVHAEAKGEPYAGKVAVADVVLNRVEEQGFPDTLEEVIYQKNAFEPVQNGSINQSADHDSNKAVEEALENNKENENLLYFYNPETATSDWILTRQVVKTIGNHAFSI